LALAAAKRGRPKSCLISGIPHPLLACKVGALFTV
jgi:hypothetical protein